MGAVDGFSQLYRGKTLTFAFFGAAFRNAGGDGPHVLRNVTIENKAVPTQTMTLPLLYTTPPLQGAQFSSSGTALAASALRRRTFSATTAPPASGT